MFCSGMTREWHGAKYDLDDGFSVDIWLVPPGSPEGIRAVHAGEHLRSNRIKSNQIYLVRSATTQFNAVRVSILN
jgi:hypothetical protein